MLRALSRDSRGGAIVELAICSMVAVPLILYANWFADAAHWKLKIEEASLMATFDLTAWRVNDFHSTSPTFNTFYSTAKSGAEGYPQNRMGTSFDSARPAAAAMESSVFVQPERLSVNCRHYNSGSPAGTLEYDSDEPTNLDPWGKRIPEFNQNTWMSCGAQAQLKTLLGPGFLTSTFSEDHGISRINPGRHGWARIRTCGVGPGVTGCGANSYDGIPIMLDDWGLWNARAGVNEQVEIPLSMERWDELADTSFVEQARAPSSDTTSRNMDYLKMAKRYWNDPNPGEVTRVVQAVAGPSAEDMGMTDYFHISYRKGDEYRYQGSVAQEYRWGQLDAFGGPNASTDGARAGVCVVPGDPPHTGGPWHEENPSHWCISKTSFYWRGDRFGAYNDYMGVKSWPKDGT